MNASLVLTVVGVDRPGLVDALAKCVAEHGGNWEEGRMARLAGRFAGLVHVTLPPNSVDSLSRALAALATAGLQVNVTPGVDNPSPPDHVAYVLEVVGNDRTGIVRDISHVLAERGVNVEEFSTERVSAPQDGGLLFRAEARLKSPPTVAASAIRQAIEGIANDLMVDIHEDDGQTS